MLTKKPIASLTKPSMVVAGVNAPRDSELHNLLTCPHFSAATLARAPPINERKAVAEMPQELVAITARQQTKKQTSED